MNKRIVSIIACGAVSLTGCQAGPAAKHTTALGVQTTEVSNKVVDAETKLPLTSRVKVDSKVDGRVRLAGDNDDDFQDSRPAEINAAPPLGPNLTALSLDDAIEAGLVQNPDLVALREAEGVSAAVFGVAQTYPFNPFVQFQATPYQRNTEGGSGSTYHYVLLMQTIQLAHQQQFREEMAASQLNQVRWNIHNAELLNTAQTARLYFTALYQRGIRDLTRSSAELNQKLLQISENQAQAGTITKADLAIVRIDTRSARQQADLGEATYQTALLDLRRQLNIPVNTAVELTGELIDLRWKSAHNAAHSQLGSNDSIAVNFGGQDEDFIKRLADGRPDLMAARADVETAHANYRLANASRTPDLQIGPYYQRDDFGTTFLGFRGQIDVPVMNNGQPLVRQRVAERQQRDVVCQQLQARVEMEAVAAVNRYERARLMVEAAHPENQDDLSTELQKLEAQFQENEVDVLRVFQGRTSLIQNRRATLDMLNELAQSAAALSAATAILPTSLVSVGEPGR